MIRKINKKLDHTLCMKRKKNPNICHVFIFLCWYVSVQMEHNCTVSDVMHVSNTRWESLPDKY